MQKEFDLIVERLEEETYDMEICEEQFDMNSPYFMDVPYKMVKMDDVKEIVNQVAEEYKSTEHINCSTDEVCEWSKMKNTQGYMRAKQHNNAEPNYKICVWKFCPYCGKKIKVVE